MVTRYWVRRVVVILPPPPEQRTPSKRKHLSADALYALLWLGFDRIPDHRGRECPISLTDALMSAFSMFALKDPSLLAFDEPPDGVRLTFCTLPSKVQNVSLTPL